VQRIILHILKWSRSAQQCAMSIFTRRTFDHKLTSRIEGFVAWVTGSDGQTASVSQYPHHSMQQHRCRHLPSAAAADDDDDDATGAVPEAARRLSSVWHQSGSIQKT